MRQNKWQGVKMFSKLSQRAWTAAREATEAIPDDSEDGEPARNLRRGNGR